MGNVLLQTPVAFMGVQPYFTTGGGLLSGERSGTQQDTGVGLNTGGGVKISLAGPLRLRVDYRVFKLGSGALDSPAHRIYAGLNLKLSVGPKARVYLPSVLNETVRLTMFCPARTQSAYFL